MSTFSKPLLFTSIEGRTYIDVDTDIDTVSVRFSS